MIISKIASLLRRKKARIFFKVYEPFVYSFCLCVLSITFTIDYFSPDEFISQADFENRAFILSLLGGCSIITIIRVISYSAGMCKWYMANIVCLLLNNLSGFARYLGLIDSISYMFIATGLSSLGIICFLVFRIFYRITDEVCLRRTGL